MIGPIAGHDRVVRSWTPALLRSYRLGADQLGAYLGFWALGRVGEAKQSPQKLKISFWRVVIKNYLRQKFQFEI